MQTKDQVSKIKNWKVITSVATASALGVSGLALAGPDRSGTPERIDLRDTASVTTIGTAPTVPTTLAEALSRVVDSVPTDDYTTDSPFDERSVQSEDSPNSPPTPDTPDQPSPDSPATPDQPSPDSPASPASVDTDDGSADT